MRCELYEMYMYIYMYVLYLCMCVQGMLPGLGVQQRLPTVTVVAHYDAYGAAPSLSTGVDSNGSGVAALLELARLFSRLERWREGGQGEGKGRGEGFMKRGEGRGGGREDERGRGEDEEGGRGSKRKKGAEGGVEGRRSGGWEKRVRYVCDVMVCLPHAHTGCTEM